MTFASSWQDYSFVGTHNLVFPAALRRALASIHDHFIPHERNNYHPHILSQRLLGLLSMLMVAVKFATIATVAFSPAPTVYSSAITVSNVFSLTNESRVAASVAALSLNSKLAQAAQAKANDMATKGYFSHNTPDGKTPWTFIQATGYSYMSAGENLAVDFTEAENEQTAWMNSPGHRANILNKNFAEIGIGIATGQFQGHTTTFVVQMFGEPAASAVTFQSQPTTVAPATPPATVVTKTSPTKVATKVTAPTSSVAHKTVAAAESPEPQANIVAAAVPEPVQIVDTSTMVKGDQLYVTVTTSGPAVKVMADYNGAAILLDPKSDNNWQGVIPLASLKGDVNVTVVASDMQGKTDQAGAASFTKSLQSNYHFLGSVKGATVSVLGLVFDPKVVEQKLYLIFIAGLLACLVLAIAVKRHIQHLSLIANSSFVIVLATMLWMAR